MKVCEVFLSLEAVMVVGEGTAAGTGYQGVDYIVGLFL